jgi:hypothetical protein
MRGIRHAAVLSANDCHLMPNSPNRSPINPKSPTITAPQGRYFRPLLKNGKLSARTWAAKNRLRTTDKGRVREWLPSNYRIAV